MIDDALFLENKIAWSVVGDKLLTLAKTFYLNTKEKKDIKLEEIQKVL